jgi:pimeloyl-ACP methyl ester carboxylesterase
VSLDPGRFAPDFGADLPRPLAEYLAHAQMPVAARVFGARIGVAAWHDKPSYFVIATEDRALDTEVAERMAERAGSKVTRVKASHAVLISQPRAVARVIESAAREVQQARRAGS